MERATSPAYGLFDRRRVPWGVVRSDGSAALCFRRVYLDKVFLSVTGSTATGRVDAGDEEALVFRKMLKQSKEIIVVADPSKLAR